MLIHRLCCFILAFLPLHAFSAPLALDINAECGILMNAETGVILYEKNAHMLRYPASITKLATAVYALHAVGDEELDVVVVADQDAVASISEEALRRSNYTRPAYWLIPGATHMGIKKGEELKFRDLLYGMMVGSASDAANVIAQHVGGTIPDFMTGLNAYVKEIGCKQTTFYNPNGLYHPNQQTTAYDMALIMREGLKNATLCEAMATVRYTRPKTAKQESTVILQTNKLLRKGGSFYYEKAIGGKTGYLSLAGHTLVAAARDADRTLIAVLLNAKERNNQFLDAIKLFDTAFSQPKVQRVLLKKGPQKDLVLNLAGGAKPVATYLSDDFSLEYYPAEVPKYKCLLQWNVAKPPIKKDQVVGHVKIVTSDGTVLQSVDLLAQEDVGSTFWWRLRSLVSNE